MKQTCPNPVCGTTYDISERHVGRRFSCKKCGTELLVGNNGVQLAESDAPPPAPPGEAQWEEMPAGSPAPGPASRYSASAAAWRTYLLSLADLSTWLFGAGVVLTVLYTFLPLIDQAKVSRREAVIVAGQLREDRLQAAFNKKEKPSAEEAERRKKAQESWEKRKNELEEDVEDAEVDLQKSMYWYRFGTLLGVLLLAGSSLVYVQPSQPLIRRILGAAVLIALIAVVFNSFGRFGFHVDLGGR
jgi:hypothetical protein